MELLTVELQASAQPPNLRVAFKMFNPRLYARKAFGAAFAPPFSPFRSSVSSSYCSHSALSSHRNSLLFVSTSRTIRPSLDSYPSRVNTYRNFTMQATGGSSSTTSKQADDPKEKFLSFLDTRKTVVLATTSPNGEAHASAVPFIHEGQLENLYVVRPPII